PWPTSPTWWAHPSPPRRPAPSRLGPSATVPLPPHWRSCRHRSHSLSLSRSRNPRKNRLLRDPPRAESSADCWACLVGPSPRCGPCCSPSRVCSPRTSPSALAPPCDVGIRQSVVIIVDGHPTAVVVSVDIFLFCPASGLVVLLAWGHESQKLRPPADRDLLRPRRRGRSRASSAHPRHGGLPPRV